MQDSNSFSFYGIGLHDSWNPVSDFRMTHTLCVRHVTSLNNITYNILSTNVALQGKVNIHVTYVLIVCKAISTLQLITRPETVHFVNKLLYSYYVWQIGGVL